MEKHTLRNIALGLFVVGPAAFCLIYVGLFIVSVLSTLINCN